MGNEKELIQSDSISLPQNQKRIHERHSKPNEQLFPRRGYSAASPIENTTLVTGDGTKLFFKSDCLSAFINMPLMLPADPSRKTTTKKLTSC